MEYVSLPSYDPIERSALYRSYHDFQAALLDWERTFGHRMRVGSSEILKNCHGTRDEVFKYRVLVLHCIHYGQPKTAETSRKAANHQGRGCNVMLRLNFSVKEQVLRVTSLIDIHSGHTLEPGSTKGLRRRRSDEQEQSAKRARLTYDSPAPVTPTTIGTKPRISYPMITALAIFNSPKGYLLNKEIYVFIETYFPYYRTAYGSWKNSIRHALHTHDYFHKENEDKENAYSKTVYSIKDVPRFMEDLAKFQEKFPDYDDRIFGLAYPAHWEPMTRGALKDPRIGMVRPVAKRSARRVKMEEEDEDYRPQESSQLRERFSHRTRGSLQMESSPVSSVYYTPISTPQEHKVPVTMHPGVPLMQPTVIRPNQYMAPEYPQNHYMMPDMHTHPLYPMGIEYNDLTLL